MNAKFRVWWIPQAPMKSFDYEVPTLEVARLLCDAFAEYDLFQYKNRIKPDYCNAGGVSFCHPEITGGEWWDWPDDEDEEAELLLEIAK